MRSFLPISILVLGLASTKPIEAISAEIQDKVTTSSFPNLIGVKKSFETQILYTNITESITHPICPTTSCFETLICRSKLFVDNSLLINYLFQNNRTLVTLPRAFGKTINLSMLKTFFQIEVNRTTGERLKLEETNSYKIFTKREINCDNGTINLRDEFLITVGNYNDVMKQMGSKPVIHLNLRVSGSVKTFQDLELLIKDRMKNLILEHDYIELAHYESHHQKYKELLEKLSSAGTENISKVLPSLAQTLEDIFKEKAVVLIDDYDDPMNTVFFDSSNFNQDQRNDVTSLIASIYRELLNTTSIQYVFFTGTLCWTDAKIFPGFYQFALNTAAGGKATNFHGLTENHIKTMFKEICYEQYFAGARAYYEGYDFGAPKKLTKYNPYSISHYVTKPKNIESHWTLKGNFSMLIDPLVKYANFNKMLYRVLLGGYIPIPIYHLKEDTAAIISFTLDDFNRLLTVMDNASLLYESQWQSIHNKDASIGLRVLFALGYLTRARANESLHHVDRRRFILAKIPNKEIENYLWSQYSSSLGTLVTDSLDGSQQLYEESMNFNKLFAHLLQTNYTNGKNFAIEFKKLMKSYPPLNKQTYGIALHNNERIIESLIETHVLSTVYRLDIACHEIQPMFNWAKRSKPDVVLVTRERRMVIIELKYNNTITLNQTINEVKKYATWFMDKRNAMAYRKILDFKLISIIVRKTLRKRVEVNVEVIPRKNLEYTLLATSTRKQPRWVRQ